MTRQTKQPTSLSIDKAVEEEEEEESVILPEPVIVPVILPPVKTIPISKFDLSSVKGYNQKRASIKQQLLISDSISELKHALAIFDPEEIRLNHSLVLFVSQIVEDIFTKQGLGHIKRTVVVEVCKDYFNDSPELVHMVIDLVFDKIIKTSLFRRNKSRVANLFFWLVRQFGGNCDVRLQTNFRTSLGH